MQTATTTCFKQKKCPKCGNNHDNEGVLCSFCILKHEEAIKKRQIHPSSFWVKTLIQREGNTVLNMGNVQYTFSPNIHGDSVCEILNVGHYNQIIKSEFYEPYSEPVPGETTPGDPEADAVIPRRSSLFSNEDADTIERLKAEGYKIKQIAEMLSDSKGEPVPWQRVMKYFEPI